MYLDNHVWGRHTWNLAVNVVGICLTGRGTRKSDGQQAMLVLETGIKRKCKCLQLHWTPCAESEHHRQNSPLSANRLSRQGKYPYWSLKSHSATAASCVAEQVSCLLLFTCVSHSCAQQGLLLSWRQSPVLKGSNMKRQKHHDFCGICSWTLHILPCCFLAGQASGEVNTTHRNLCTFERDFSKMVK